MSGSHVAISKFRNGWTWGFALSVFGFAVIVVTALASYLGVLSLHVMSFEQESLFGILIKSTIIMILFIAVIVFVSHHMITVLDRVLRLRPEMSDRKKMHIMQAQVLEDFRLMETRSK